LRAEECALALWHDVQVLEDYALFVLEQFGRRRRAA
jgi:hypothetical protein